MISFTLHAKIKLNTHYTRKMLRIDAENGKFRAYYQSATSWVKVFDILRIKKEDLNEIILKLKTQ